MRLAMQRGQDSVNNDRSRILVFDTFNNDFIAARDIGTVGGDEIKTAIPQTSTDGRVRVIAGVDALRAAIRAVKSGQPINYDGVGGPDDFNQCGDVRGYLGRKLVQNGNWIIEEMYDCTQSSDTCPLLQ